MKTLVLSLSLVTLVAFGAGCAASTDDGASDSNESDVVAGHAELKTGSFKLYGEAHHVPSPSCDLFTKLTIANGIAGPVATLAGGVTGFCRPAVAAPVVYNLKFKTTDCGTLVYEGSNAGRKIVLRDNRTRICRDLQQAQIIVDETVNGGAPHRLFSYDNAVSPEPTGPVVFSRDDRPVDGVLKELTLSPKNGKWDATLRTALYDRLAGHPVDTTDEIAFGLDCKLEREITCRVDKRPVDGALTELKITQSDTPMGDDNTWIATLHTSIFDRMTGREVEKTTELASGLRRK